MHQQQLVQHKFQQQDNSLEANQWLFEVEAVGPSTTLFFASMQNTSHQRTNQHLEDLNNFHLQGPKQHSWNSN
jgi:hypothetical protein